MTKRHRISKLAVAGAVSLGTLATGAVASVAGAATPIAAATRAVSTQRSTQRVAATRTIEDATFRVARSVETRRGARRVVFYATDLRTGRTIALN